MMTSLYLLWFVQAAASDWSEATVPPWTPYGGLPEVQSTENGLHAHQLAGMFQSHLKVLTIANAVVFSCRSEYDQFLIQKRLHLLGVTCLMVDIRGTESADPRVWSAMYNTDRLGVLVETACRNTPRVIDKCSSLSLFSEKISWLVVTSSAAEAAAALAGADLNVDSDVVALVPHHHRHIWLSFDVYSHGFRYRGDFIMTFRGIYNPNNTKQVSKSIRVESTKYPRDMSLNQREIITDEGLKNRVDNFIRDVNNFVELLEDVSGKDVILMGERKFENANGWWIFLVDSWVKRRWRVRNVTLVNAYMATTKFRGTVDDFALTPRQVHVDMMHRYNRVLLQHVADMVGFSVSHMRVRSWGVVRNGTAKEGIMGVLQRGDADITTAPVNIRPDRVGLGHPTVITYVGKIGLLFLQPQHDEVSLSVFTRPLTDAVWLAALALCGAIAVFFICVVRIENAFLGAGEDSVEGTWHFAVLHAMSVFNQQGVSRSPRLCSGRTLSLCGMVLGVMLYQFYSAFLVGSLLTAPRKTVKTPLDIPGHFDLGIEDMPYERDFLRERARYTYGEEVFGHPRALRRGDKIFMSAQEGLARVRQGGFAFQMDTEAAYKMVQSWREDEVCRLDLFFVFPILKLPSRARRGLPFLQHILTGYRLLLERGVKAHELATWATPARLCPAEYSAALRPVGVQVLSAVIALAAAGILSLLVLAAEIIIFKLRQKPLPYVH